MEQNRTYVLQWEHEGTHFYLDFKRIREAYKYIEESDEIDDNWVIVETNRLKNTITIYAGEGHASQTD